MKRPRRRKRLTVEMDLGRVAGPDCHVWINGIEISDWVTGVELDARVGDVMGLTIHLLPDDVRLRHPIARYVSTGYDGVTREVHL